ncbi:MAG: hypothetical protein HYV45_03685 [Candidatus Moranbacteria bacterium]|nr:hypothetical protein [Candidatus Moranbacteria bacterium]
MSITNSLPEGEENAMFDNARFQEWQEKIETIFEKAKTFQRSAVSNFMKNIGEKYQSVRKSTAFSLQKSQDIFSSFFSLNYSLRGLLVIFIVALFLGAFFKTSAENYLTIGFDDYLLSSNEKTYDLDALEDFLIRSGGSSVSSRQEVGGACSQ